LIWKNAIDRVDVITWKYLTVQQHPASVLVNFAAEEFECFRLAGICWLFSTPISLGAVVAFLLRSKMSVTILVS
jgi:hypothetical protein